MTEIVTDIVAEQQLRDSFRKHAAFARLLLTDPPLELGEWSGEVAEDCTTIRADTPEGRVAARFGSSDELLPRLEHLGAQSSPVANAAPNRVRALVHYFMALVENPAREAEPFFELLAPSYSLHYPAEPITQDATLRGWVAGPLSSVVASEHVIHSVSSEHAADGWSARVTMKSQALFPDGSGAISRNTQTWRGTDDPDERFPRIEEILIDRDAVIFFDAAGRRTH